MSLIDQISVGPDGWRRKLGRFEWGLYFVFVLLAATGTLMLYGAAGGSWTPWAINHVTRFILFSSLMFLVALTDVRIWFSFSYPAWAISMVLLILVELIGKTTLGAQRWLVIGPIQIQPSEFMKMAVAMAIARYYHDMGGMNLRHIKHHIIPLILVIFPMVLIMHQPNLGAALQVGAVGITLIILAGLSWWVVASGGLVAVVGATVGFFYFMTEFQKERVYNFLDPSRDPLGTGYHITQSKIAIGSGGLFGVGYMHGTQSQLDFLPERQTDFILAMLLEEFGFVGGVFVLGLYIAAIAYGLLIAMSCRQLYGRYLAAGLTMLLFVYVAINAGMIVGLLPVVGEALPVLSYGGTVMLSVLIAMGLVQNMKINRDQNLGNSFGKKR